MTKITLLSTFFAIIFSTDVLAQNDSEPWKPEQLIAPASLAATIRNDSVEKPLIICVGPAGLIKGAVDIGPAGDKANIEKLRQLLSNEKKDREIVIYCGCCPYRKCPNIRPAFSLLNSMKFTNHKLLDLPDNLKINWIDHGYPMNN